MNNSDTLLRCIEHGDATDTTVAAALDALQEDTGCDLLAAVHQVAERWRVGVDARELARALKAVARGASHRAELLALIASEGNLQIAGPFSVQVEIGDAPPHFAATGQERRGAIFAAYTATVGARWVLEKLVDLEEGIRQSKLAQADEYGTE